MRRGRSISDAIGISGGDLGDAPCSFAGITVCIALLGMLTVGVSVLFGRGRSQRRSRLLLPMAAAQTLAPGADRLPWEVGVPHPQARPPPRFRPQARSISRRPLAPFGPSLGHACPGHTAWASAAARVG